MAKLLDYLDLRRDITLKERPFNIVDALALTELSYMDWDGIVGSKEITVKEAVDRYLEQNDEESMQKKYVFSYLLHPFLVAIQNNTRLGSLKMKNYAHKFDEEECVQFAAVTFVLDRNTLFVAYQGTDSTMLGWEEDFHLTYMEEIPAQRYAKEYLKNVDKSRIRKKNIYVSGHSKGGNLAMYAAIENPEMANQIVKVFNFEGPGFLDSYLEKTDLSFIIDKTIGICTESSIVGRLLGHKEAIRYVKCDTPGLAQHSPFTWILDLDDFVYVEGLDKKSDEYNETLNKILLNKDLSERKHYSELLFKVLKDLKVNTVGDLLDLNIAKLSTSLQVFKNMTNQERLFTTQLILFLLEQSRTVFVGSISIKNKPQF